MMIDFKLNRSDYKLLILFSIFFTVWLLFKFWIEGYSLNQILFDTPIIVLKTMLAVLIIRWLIQKYLVEKKYYIIFFLLSISAFIFTGFIDTMRDYYGSGYSWAQMPNMGKLIVDSFYYSAADMALPFTVLIAKKYFENQTELVKTREQKKEGELKLLRSQLSPHFLFNNLNTLNALVDSRPKIAKEYISKLSSIYRYLIKSKDDDVLPLSEEIEMIKDYFYLINVRYGNAYTFNIEYRNSFKEMVFLPTSALQTIVENVIKHNKVVDNISINTRLVINEEMVMLCNNKSKEKIEDNLSLGTGLKNLKARYKLLSDKELYIEDSKDIFKIYLPLIKIEKR